MLADKYVNDIIPGTYLNLVSEKIRSVIIEIYKLGFIDGYYECGKEHDAHLN